MRVLHIGGTKVVGPAAVPQLLAAGHEVAVAHSGAHEHPAVAGVQHLHGSREELLAPGGPVERWRPDVIVDPFPGGASAAKATQLAQVASRAGAGQLITISSIDVYQHAVDGGMADGSGSRLLAPTPIPVREDVPLRVGPYPGGSEAHDNVAAEAALHDWGRVTALRAGAIYGPFAHTRERYFVELVAAGTHRLPLPAGGTQLMARVAAERVGRAVAAAVEHAPAGFWPCNVADPYDWDHAGLAAVVGDLLGWTWEPEVVPFDDAEHPWALAHPLIISDERLRHTLHVSDPDPREALAETITFLADELGLTPPRRN